MSEKALDVRGKPIPWITYPAYELLRAKDLRGKRVLEFGSGQSTLWFVEQGALVRSFESDAAWHGYVRGQLPPSATVDLVSFSLDEVESTLRALPPFDVILVDGLDRVRAAELARLAVAEDGVIIVDNSDEFRDERGRYPLMDGFREAGYSRVDFYGMAPGVVQPHCTSMFFKGRCSLFAGTENPTSHAL